MTSSSNGDGILHITTEGMQKMQIGHTGKIIEVDVMATLSSWADVDRAFRDENGQVPSERLLDHAAASLEFTRELFRRGGEEESLIGAINATQALAVLAGLEKKGRELRRFFVVSSESEAFSPGHTELTFSEES